MKVQFSAAIFCAPVALGRPTPSLVTDQVLIAKRPHFELILWVTKEQREGE